MCGATATSQEYLDATLAALACDRRLVVRLDAPEETLRERLRLREPTGWTGLRQLLDASGAVAETSRELVGVDMVCRTDTEPPEVLASRIVAALPDG